MTEPDWNSIATQMLKDRRESSTQPPATTRQKSNGKWEFEVLGAWQGEFHTQSGAQQARSKLREMP